MVVAIGGKASDKQFVETSGACRNCKVDAHSDASSGGADHVHRGPAPRGAEGMNSRCWPRAASETGGIATQNRGTLGGNIVQCVARRRYLSCWSTTANWSWFPRRLTLGPVSHVHTGYKQMLLRAGELDRRILLPRGRARGLDRHYRKVGTRRAQAISKVCLAGTILRDGSRIADVRMALGSVAPTVMRCYRTEQSLRDDPAKLRPRGPARRGDRSDRRHPVHGELSYARRGESAR